ncbi:MAG: creatininase family protein [Myxococcota bacterium]
MSTPADTAARGRALLAERIAAAPAHVAAVPEILAPLVSRPVRLPRCLVTTGIGTSEGHARHLAELAARFFDQPARYASTGSLAAGPPPGADRDWLVVFSQGLSANARFALRDVEAWGGVVLVTGLALEGPHAAQTRADKREWLVSLERRGVVRIELGCGPEYGMLPRVIGARMGYAVAWSLLRTLAHRRLERLPALAIDADRLARAQRAAPEEARRVFPTNADLVSFFAPERTLLLIGEGGSLDLCDHLALKLAEGMLRPQPRALDLLQFAHGPLQSLAARPLSILHVAPHQGAPTATTARARSAPEFDWLARLAATLDPALHDLRTIRTALPLPFASVELEAIFDDWTLRSQTATGLDLVSWPGADREDALYAVGPALGSEGDETPLEAAHSATSAAGVASGPTVLEEAVWPELERSIAAGRRTAIVALGSIEQHGPHLPLATDRWIAEALAKGLAERVGDAIAVPAIPFGCASEHLDFPGTLHVEPETLEATLDDLLASLRRHGFERAFVFSAHGGNAAALRAMSERVVRRARPLVVRIEQGIDVGRLQAEVVARRGLPGASAGPHAGEYETSLVAWLRPGSVRPGALVAGPPIGPATGASLFYPSVRPNAPQGVLGDPTGADRAAGRDYRDAWLDALELAYRAMFDVAR